MCPIKYIFILLIAVLVILGGVSAADQPNQQDKLYKIGVLAKRGPDRCLEKWRPTAEYLSRQIPGGSFTIVSLAFEQVAPAVKDGRIDFLLTNPSLYVEMEILYGVRRIATLKNLRSGKPVTVYGGVIFTAADRNDINKLDDLRGKTFIAVSERSLGGWLAARREFEFKGIDPYKDFADLSFCGTHDAVVYAVRNGRADAGTVRTDTFERMAAEGKIEISDFHFIHEHEGDHSEYKGELYNSDTFEDYNFIHSTRLYPEWPIAQLKHIPDNLAEKVAFSLLNISSDGPAAHAAHAAHCAGWTIPHNYQSVRDCLKELRIGPYKDYGKVTIGGVVRQYGSWLVGLIIIGIAMAVAIVNILALNRRLLSTKKELEEEITDNKRQKIEKEQLNSRLKASVDKVNATKDFLESVMEGVTNAIYVIDLEDNFTLTNRASSKITGYAVDELVGQSFSMLLEGDTLLELNRQLTRVKALGATISQFETEFVRKNRTKVFVNINLSPLYEDGKIISVVGTAEDITRRKELERQLLQAQKLESVGQLASGIAHEINTPTQYVGDNIRFLQESFTDMTALLQKHEQLLARSRQGGVTTDIISEVEETKKEIDIDYLLDEIPQSICQTIEGVERVSQIVRAMKEFSHPDLGGKTLTDINRAIESTLTVARTKWKYIADTDIDFDAELPMVPCLPGEFNQVILNIVVNAAHAIKDAIGDDTEKKGTIGIQTRQNGENVEIRISDTGTGIPEEIQDKIFDPFFTTKQIGEGSGQGLAISRSIIVDKHDGSLTFETEAGKGTTFVIRLPIDNEQD